MYCTVYGLKGYIAKISNILYLHLSLLLIYTTLHQLSADGLAAAVLAQEPVVNLKFTLNAGDIQPKGT